MNDAATNMAPNCSQFFLVDGNDHSLRSIISPPKVLFLINED